MTGIKEKRRTIPIHKLAMKLGQNICSCLVAAHHLSGSDYTSKVGTKKAALRADPQKYLRNFGRGSSDAFIENSIDDAEIFLIQALHNGSDFKNFNEFRIYQYRHGKNHDLTALPPTSTSIRLHIRRAFYVTYLQLHCLQIESTDVEVLNPENFGYEIRDDLLLPEKPKILIPSTDEFVPGCTCRVCVRATCCCVLAQISCCSFCACKKKNSCKNKFAPQI